MNNKVNLDTVGIVTSIACAIHCAVLPLFFTSLPFLGINIVESLSFEIAMIATAFVIGVLSFYHGYKRHHHSFLPMIVFCIGFGFLVLKMFFAKYELWLLMPAVTAIIGAHVINYKACRIHNHAHKDDCDH